MRTSSRISAFALALSALVACGGAKDAAQSADSTATKQMKVALLTPGPVSDRSWNGIAYAGLQALKDSLGASVSHIQTKTPAEFEENFRQYGVQGYDLVIGNGFEYQDAAARVAPSYPKTHYAITSGRATAANLSGFAFAFEEASYQAGMIAAATSKTGKLGMIAGQELPPVKASFTAFERGARSINPKIEVLTSYLGNWDDVSAAREQALAQINRGVDVIFQNADAAGLGIFQAAKEKHVYAFGTNANQNAVAPEVILASVVIDLPRAFLLLGREIQKGPVTGRVINLGVKDDVVRLEYNDALKSKIPATALAASDSVGGLLKAGTFAPLRDLLSGSDSAKPVDKKD
jgi:basic membrane lipoprotein Med (substrate-binding protein (PBP1-ABC) superfamily)